MSRSAFYACGCCGAYHPVRFTGDCRDDSNRYADIPDGALEVSQDEADAILARSQRTARIRNRLKGLPWLK